MLTAIGTEEFIAAAKQTVAYRQSMQRYEITSPAGEKAWAVKEKTCRYMWNSEAKSHI